MVISTIKILAQENTKLYIMNDLPNSPMFSSTKIQYLMPVESLVLLCQNIFPFSLLFVAQRSIPDHFLILTIANIINS